MSTSSFFAAILNFLFQDDKNGDEAEASGKKGSGSRGVGSFELSHHIRKCNEQARRQWLGDKRDNQPSGSVSGNFLLIPGVRIPCVKVNHDIDS